MGAPCSALMQIYYTIHMQRGIHMLKKLSDNLCCALQPIKNETKKKQKLHNFMVLDTKPPHTEIALFRRLYDIVIACFTMLNTHTHRHTHHQWATNLTAHSHLCVAPELYRYDTFYVSKEKREKQPIANRIICKVEFATQWIQSAKLYQCMRLCLLLWIGMLNMRTTPRLQPCKIKFVLS